MIKITDYKLPKSLFFLYSNRLIISIGAGLWGLFLPIFLFEKFASSYVSVIIFFLLIFLASIFLHPVGAIIMSKTGLRKAMIIGIFFLICYYLSFYYYDKFPFLILLIFAGLANNFWRILYWVPFHTDFAKFSGQKNRGKQYSLFILVSDILGILVPVLAGLILNYFDYSVLFVIAIVIIASSILPIYKIPRNNEKFTFSYWQTYKELFSQKNRKMLLAYTADGAETIIGAIIWPIFIFVVLKEGYLAVGAVSALVIGITVVLDIVIGMLSDKFNKKNIIGYSSVFYALGWIIKIFVASSFHIFVVSTYHNLTGVFRRIPFDALMYEKAADQGHYVDEYTVLREISLNIGRVLMLALVAILIFYFGIIIAFILAAITSFFINILE